jgi:hypothetical protein
MDSLSPLQLEILLKGSLPDGYLLLTRFQVDAPLLVNLGLLAHEAERYWVTEDGRLVLERCYPALLLETQATHAGVSHAA